MWRAEQNIWEYYIGAETQLSSGNQWKNEENADHWTKYTVNVRMTALLWLQFNRGKMQDLSDNPVYSFGIYFWVVDTRWS